MIRSLAYFLPVIEEVLAMRVSPRIFPARCGASSNESPMTGRPPCAPLARMMEHQPRTPSAWIRNTGLPRFTPKKHAFGVDESPPSGYSFPVPFLEWVT